MLCTRIALEYQIFVKMVSVHYKYNTIWNHFIFAFCTCNIEISNYFIPFMFNVYLLLYEYRSCMYAYILNLSKQLTNGHTHALT